MIKKILGISIISQYDVLSVFLKEIYQGFEAQGYEVETFTFDEQHGLSDLLNKPFHQYEFVFSINSAVLEELACVLPATTPAVAFVVNHPIHQDLRLRNACLTYLVSHGGKHRVEYADELYKNINSNVYIPNAGSKAHLDIPFEQRKYDVVLLGGYSDPSEILERIDKEDDFPLFNKQLINLSLSDEKLSWGDAIRQVCVENGLKISDAQLAELGRYTMSADEFFRMYTREMLVRQLLESGIYVDVFGNGWENMKCSGSEFLRIHKPIPYTEALEVMANSKIVLNITPTLNAGVHERVFSAMANGALCFSNYSSYFEDTGLDEFVVIYSIHHLEQVPQMVQKVLSNQEVVKEITKKAQKCALEEHTWANRAQMILEYVESYKKKHNYEDTFYENRGKREFYELIKFINSNEERLLYEKMKCCVERALEYGDGGMERALQSYNEYGYWGGCLRWEEDYELLENRANILKHHTEEFVWLYEHLADERSKRVVYALMRHWLDYSPQHLMDIQERIYDPYFDLDIVSCCQDEVFVDVGAYTGDTVSSYIKNFGTYKKIYCYDVDETNLNICKENLRLYEEIEYKQCAVGSERGVCFIESKKDSSANHVAEHGDRRAEMVSLDEDILESITFVKMDIEGSEQSALQGAKNHIMKEHPKLAIAIYHGNEDIWKIPKMIYEMDPSYQFYIRYYGGTLYPSEYILYAI